MRATTNNLKTQAQAIAKTKIRIAIPTTLHSFPPPLRSGTSDRDHQTPLANKDMSRNINRINQRSDSLTHNKTWTYISDIILTKIPFRIPLATISQSGFFPQPRLFGSTSGYTLYYFHTNNSSRYHVPNRIFLAVFRLQRKEPRALLE